MSQYGTPRAGTVNCEETFVRGVSGWRSEFWQMALGDSLQMKVRRCVAPELRKRLIQRARREFLLLGRRVLLVVMM